MNKDTAANLLHTKKFVRKKIDSPTGSTDMPKGSFPGIVSLPETPTVTEEERLAIKAHEYAHIALFERDIVPESFVQEFMDKGASSRLMNVCMDAAVNGFAASRIADLPMGAMKMTKKKFAEKMREMNVEERVCTYLQMCTVLYNGYSRYQFRRKEINTPYHRRRHKRLSGLVDEARRSIGSDSYSLRLVNLVNDIVNIAHDGFAHGSSNFSFHIFKTACERLLYVLQSLIEAEENVDEFEKELRDKTDFEIDPRGVEWGVMSVIECKLENSMPRTWKQRHKPQYAGSLRYMHRTITDMKVWGLKDRSIPPLAVLIDCSGSMEIKNEDILAILEKQPASVVAGYSGDGSRGSVYIIGSNGKYATEGEIENTRSECGFGNIVDGPALLWLSRQAGRKIWICDGYVTCSMERRTREAADFCGDFIKKAGIEYYLNIDEFFEGKRRNFVNFY